MAPHQNNTKVITAMDVKAFQTRKQLLTALHAEQSPAQRAALERTIATVGAQETIKEHFPELWPAVDVGLSVCASLLLADNANPVAVVFVRMPSSGKTTVVN